MSETTEITETPELTIDPVLFERIVTEFNQVSEYSPYVVAKKISKLVRRTVKPQMIYQYVRKNYIPSSVNVTNHLVVRKDDAAAFAVRYIVKNG